MLVDAIRAATYGVLEHARGQPSCCTRWSPQRAGADTELLPLLTTHSESLLGVAKTVVTERVHPYDLGLDGPAARRRDRRRRAGRAQPRDAAVGPPGPDPADGIAWLAGRALG